MSRARFSCPAGDSINARPIPVLVNELNGHGMNSLYVASKDRLEFIAGIIERLVTVMCRLYVTVT